MFEDFGFADWVIQHEQVDAEALCRIVLDWEARPEVARTRVAEGMQGIRSRHAALLISDFSIDKNTLPPQDFHDEKL